jgi:hypothetical protein
MSNRFHTAQTITAGGFVGDLTGDVTGDITGDITGYVNKVAGTIATNTTGVAMPADTDFVTITSANANNIAILPAPVVGKVVRGAIAGTGCEIRSSAPTSILLNGVTGANVECAIPANSSFEAICTGATKWILLNFSSTGEVSSPTTN